VFHRILAIKEKGKCDECGCQFVPEDLETGMHVEVLGLKDTENWNLLYRPESGRAS
jgi:hypothetical protein